MASKCAQSTMRKRDRFKHAKGRRKKKPGEIEMNKVEGREAGQKVYSSHTSSPLTHTAHALLSLYFIHFIYSLYSLYITIAPQESQQNHHSSVFSGKTTTTTT